MRAPVRRVTRQYRCKRCGFQATYQNAGAVQARYWFDRHSCQKRETRMVKAVMAEMREAAIDRTPKPCMHKIADHQHGTRACYVLDTCRCTPCSKANSAAENERTRLKAYGRYHKYVDAHPVRLHLAELKEYGIGLKQVSRVSGVSNGSLTNIWYGLYETTGMGRSGGINGAGNLTREPSRRVLRITAERIYAVEAVSANLSPGQVDRERTSLARTHLQALVALGWSMSKLARRLDMDPGNFTSVIHGPRMMVRETVDRAEALFEELSMTLPPRSSHRDKSSYSRAVNYAKAVDWVPPLALDDLDIPTDLEVVEQDFDVAAVWRACNGDRAVALSTTERAEVVRIMHRRGLTDVEIATLTGIKCNTVKNVRQRLDLPVNKTRVDWSEYSERAHTRKKEAV